MRSDLQLAPGQGGFIVRLVGRGTLQESPTFLRLIEKCLAKAPVVVDVSQCEYLDSTFLGCLIGLKKRCETNRRRRFWIAADDATRLRLFSTSMLDRVLDFIPTCPTAKCDFQSIETETIANHELGEHVMQCHRQLAELGGEDSATFQSIADRLAKELGESSRD